MAKKKSNNKPKSKMLPSKIPNIIHQQDYSTLISEPKAADFASLSKEVNEYQKVLNGEASSKALTILPPFGRIYFEDTGETCTGPDGKNILNTRWLMRICRKSDCSNQQTEISKMRLHY